MPSLLGLRGSILFLAVLGGIHIIEEGIGKFADLGVVHLVIFMIEMLLHDSLVARHEAAIRFKCCSNVSCLNGFVCQRCSLQRISSCWHMGRCGFWLIVVEDDVIDACHHAFDHVLGGHLSLDPEKRISRLFGVFMAICVFHKIARNFTDFHGISRPFVGISRSFHEISRFFTAMSGRTPLSRPLGGFTAIFPRGTRPPKTRSYACLGCGRAVSPKGLTGISQILSPCSMIL